MLTAAIPFPDIGTELFSVDIGGFHLALRWYALAYIVGILIGWRLCVRAVRRAALWPESGPPMTAKQLEDFLTWMILGVILGGRLGFVLFYQPQYYFQNPLEILMVWQGGMSFHGGLAGVTIAMVLFARSRGIGVWRLADIISACAPIGLFFGRIANFINGELWGRETDVPWAMIFPGAGPLPRHPSQIYEAGLEGLVLFAVLRLLTYHSVSLALPGLTTGAFLTGYALTRMFAEFFRQPDVQLGFLFEGWLTMGMVLSAPMFLAGLFLLLRARLLRQRQSETEPTTGGQGA